MEKLKYTKFNNLVFKKIGPEFDMDLSNCNFIISSSGHLLISEAINLGIPLYIFPLDTFDQNYCCKMVEKNSFGKAIKKCNKAGTTDLAHSSRPTLAACKLLLEKITRKIVKTY